MPRLAILGSTRGTHLLTLVEAIQQNQLLASIEIVISNRPDAMILERAQSFHLRAEYINPTNLSREEYDQIISTKLKHYSIDCIVLIGYMRILSAAFVKEWENKIINVHPSLLPKFAGKMDLAVHQAVLDAKEIETGCTVHYVTEEVDGGPILIQKKCPVLSTDTAHTLKSRVQVLESEALIEAISYFCLMP